MNFTYQELKGPTTVSLPSDLAGQTAESPGTSFTYS